jgi:hypothetical protein
VVEWDGLENRCTGNCTEGSNPSLSATMFLKHSTSNGLSGGWLLGRKLGSKHVIFKSFYMKRQFKMTIYIKDDKVGVDITDPDLENQPLIYKEAVKKEVRRIVIDRNIDGEIHVDYNNEKENVLSFTYTNIPEEYKLELNDAISSVAVPEKK